MLEMPEALRRAIREEGEKAYPHECCGFVLGSYTEDGTRTMETLIPIVNAWAAEEQYHRFSITAEDVMGAEKQSRALNRDIIGIYHSHPDHPARPSEYDREQALPFYSYLIVSVQGGKAADLTCWELAADRSAFIEEELIWR
ncbi:MAG: M67 family metallopeptidase [Spirochaetaceae bacterium]|jgi:proteasome lid subunit RPN8/RPN11|nr:M67 family metallopeptidase [Spirochaetaceae bacterium]